MNSAPPLNRVRNLLKQFFPEITGIACLSLIWLLEPYRHFIFFKDYGIIWEAAYRISLGQIPFIDFSTPVGPGSFLIPAFFFELMGPSWHSLQIAQLSQCSILLLSGYFILKKTGVHGLNLSASILIFTLLYLIFLSHPWYNSTATLFLFISLAITLSKNPYAFFLAGIFSGFSFLTKQDTGIFNLVALSLITLFINREGSRHHSRAIDLVQSLAGMILIIFVFALCISFSSFNTWLLNSFTLALQRGNGWDELLKGAPILILGIVCFSQFLMTKKNFLLYTSIINFSAFIGFQTKALFFTNFYYTVFTYLTLIYFIKKGDRLLLIFVTALTLLSTFAPIISLINLGQTTFSGAPEPYSLKQTMVTKPVIISPTGMKILDGVWAPPETFKAIEEIRRISREMQSKSGAQPSILNISELTPIYGETGVIPPTNIPLWFDPKLTISPSDALYIKQELNSSKFNIVILQSTFGGMNAGFYGPILELLKNNKDYISLSEDGYYSPSSSLSACQAKKACVDHNLFIFTRK